MNLRKILGFQLILLLFGLISAEAAGFTAGNIVVVRVGDGSAALSATATAAFLQEYTPLGSLVQTIALPTSVSGANHPLTLTGTATSEGFLKTSADNHYLTLAGYAAAPGTASVASTASSLVNRVVAMINVDGGIDTRTALSDAFSGSNVRGVVSFDGTQAWISGTSSGSSGGVHYASLGNNTSTQIISAPQNVRCLNIAAGQIYLSSAAVPFVSVSSIGTGLPTTSGQIATTLPGFPTTSGPSPYDFCFVGSSTLYVADDRSGSLGGGIQKWALNGSTWSLQYTLVNAGCRGLTCALAPDGTTVILYAITVTAPNSLISVTDTGSNAVPSTLAAAAANTAFRGIANAPTSAVLQRPSLVITQSVGGVIVSWPSPSTGWTLQYNQDLAASNWSNSTATIINDGTNKSVLVSPIGKQFLRLSH